MIKSYTDLQQSKKLAEILPIESADMKWYFWKEEIDAPKVPTFGYSKTAAESYKDTEAVYLPCWSLAALISILPAECECMSLEHINYGNNHKKYFMSYVGGGNTDIYNNPIDACVAMIEKLHELNLL